MSGQPDARSVFNVPTLVPTKRGSIAVRELSVVAGIQAVDRLLRCLRGFQQSHAESNLDKLADALKYDPLAVIDVVGLATDAPDVLPELSLCDFLDVASAFLEQNEGLIDRFLRLGDQIAEVARRNKRAVPVPASSASSIDSSPAAGALPTSEN